MMDGSGQSTSRPKQRKATRMEHELHRKATTSFGMMHQSSGHASVMRCPTATWLTGAIAPVI